MPRNSVNPIEPYTLKNGEKRYRFQIYLGTNPLTGKEQRTTRSNFKTQKEAKVALLQIKYEIDKGTFQKKSYDTYGELYVLWIENYKNNVEASTYRKTLGIFKNHILPVMKDYRIEKITIDICQKHVNEWAQKFKNYRATISYAAKVLDFAIKRGIIQTNPYNLVDMPTAITKRKVMQQEEKEENFYTKNELNNFLTCLKSENDFKKYTLFHVLAYTGMRKGELLALKWTDIDFENHEITVSKAISLDYNNKIYLKSTKTGKTRIISIDSNTENILMQWKKQQMKDCMVLGFNAKSKTQLVFSNKYNSYMQPSLTQKWLKKITDTHKLKAITTHGFRHTHCSLLFEAGVTIKEVQDRLGHTDVQTTMNIYAHVSPERKTSAIDKFAHYLAN
ncbi:site-specific integrase [Solibacillus sp. A46]|uniref:Site-specific integrase n=1 Tax=Solibacillus faecavium TaxID=2762221 RepID=A0ABR8XXE6_9BACL|nr:tyrosine-type recombinase/integrase [Solibacillus faecavium]MBD8036618.1 site-specific integrase [Solibacillus faecavium]